MLRHVRVGAAEDEDHVRPLGSRRPHLLPGYDDLVTIDHTTRLDRAEVGAVVGFGVMPGNRRPCPRRSSARSAYAGAASRGR